MTDTSLHDRLEPVAWQVRTSDNLGGFLCDSEPHNAAALIRNGYAVNPLYGPEAAERIRALEEGLRPFAEAAAARDGQNDWSPTDTLVIYLRRARSLLAQTTGGTGG